MGLVASLASAPLTIEIVRDEVKREFDRREAIKYGKYKVGDTDLVLIKKLTMESAAKNGSGINSAAHYTTPKHVNGDANNKIEQIYLTGVNKEKYRYISKKIHRQDSNTSSGKTPSHRKTRSAYPTVRFQ